MCDGWDAAGFLKIVIHRVQCPLSVQLQVHSVEWNWPTHRSRTPTIYYLPSKLLTFLLSMMLTTLQIDNQKVCVSEPSPHLASTTKCSTCVYSLPKGTKAVEKAMLTIASPQKTREQTNWVVKIWSKGCEIPNYFLVRNRLAPIGAACPCLNSIFGFHGLY